MLFRYTYFFVNENMDMFYLFLRYNLAEVLSTGVSVIRTPIHTDAHTHTGAMRWDCRVEVLHVFSTTRFVVAGEHPHFFVMRNGKIKYHSIKKKDTHTHTHTCSYQILLERPEQLAC